MNKTNQFNPQLSPGASFLVQRFGELAPSHPGNDPLSVIGFQDIQSAILRNLKPRAVGEEAIRVEVGGLKELAGALETGHAVTGVAVHPVALDFFETHGGNLAPGVRAHIEAAPDWLFPSDVYRE